MLKVLLIVLMLSYWAAAGSCPIYDNPLTGLSYDLNPLQTFVRDYEASSSKGDIIFNFCKPLVNKCKPIVEQSACLYTGLTVESSYGLGDAKSMVLRPLGETDGVSVVYSTPSTTCLGGKTEMLTEIEVNCDKLALQPRLGRTEVDQVLCNTRIEFYSIHGCGVSASSPSPAMSPHPVPSPSRIPSPPPTDPNLYPNIAGTNEIGKAFNILESSENFDLLVGKPLSNTVFADFSYFANKTWQITDKVYGFPDQVTITRAQSYGVKTYSYQSVDDYMNQVAKNMGVNLQYTWHHIPIGGSTTFSKLNADMSSEGAVFSFATENVPLYVMNMYPNVTLSSEFVTRVQQLQQSNYEDFFQDYGTHVQTGLELGGKLSLVGVVTESETSSQTSMNVEVSAHVAFMGVKAGSSASISPYAGINKDYVSSSFKSAYSTYKYGGDTSIGSNQNNWYSRWVESVPDSPVAIERKLTSIVSLIQKVSPRIADGYDNWLQEKIKEYEEENNISPAAPAQIHYSSKHCDIGESALTSISFYFDDDDDCQSDAWIVSADDGSVTNMACRFPSAISWYHSNVFGSTPYSPHSLEQEKHETGSTTTKPRTHEIQQGNYQCGFYPCIPGLDSMSLGFDIVTGAPRLPANLWTFSKGNTWHSPVTGKTYAYPDQITLSVNSGSSSIQDVYTSFQSYAANASDSSSSGWDGLFFQFGTEEQSIRRTFDGAESVLGLAEESYISYIMEVSDMAPSYNLAYALDLLPTKYDAETYYEFLSYWGTHVATQASYGGKVRMYTYIDQEFYMNNEQTDIEHNIGVQFSHWKAGVGWGNDASSTTLSLSRESFQWVTFYGGDATLSLTNQWDDWIQSTHFAPAQVNKNLVPISSFATDSHVQQNIDKAINDYYVSQTPSAQLPIYLGMTLDVSFDIGGAISDYSTTCSWTHGLGWTEVSHFATGTHTCGFEFMNIPLGYFRPYVVTTSSTTVKPTSSGEKKCPTDSFIGFISKLSTFCGQCSNGILPLGDQFHCHTYGIAV